jgi:hypothetical protein
MRVGIDDPYDFCEVQCITIDGTCLTHPVEGSVWMKIDTAASFQNRPPSNQADDSAGSSWIAGPGEKTISMTELIYEWRVFQ